MNAQTKIEPATLHQAMAAAFGEIEAATKSANNPHFKSKYADLSQVIDAIKPALIRHGLFFTQRPQPSENGITITTFLHHACGDWMELGCLFVPANKNDAQGFGSALTYARRYALVTAFGVPTEDDDGNAASRREGQSERTVSPPADMPDTEWSMLVQLIEATKSDRQKMLAHFKVPDLRKLDQSQYAEALDMLNTKLAAMAKAETDAKAKAAPKTLADELNDEIPNF